MSGEKAFTDSCKVFEDEVKYIRGITVRRENEIAEADRHRKSQIRNINQHYEFELSRAKVKFTEDLQLWRSRQKHDTPLGLKKNVEQNVLNVDSFFIPPQVIRPVPAATANLVRYSACGDITALQLGDQSISEDILEASRDLRYAAMEYSKSVPEKMNVTVIAETCEITIGTEIFGVGDMVQCLSSLSQEVFHGMISSITDTTMLLICGNSARFTLPLGQVREGRIKVSIDTETIQNTEILEKHIKLLQTEISVAM